MKTLLTGIILLRMNGLLFAQTPMPIKEQAAAKSITLALVAPKGIDKTFKYASYGTITMENPEITVFTNDKKEFVRVVKSQTTQQERISTKGTRVVLRHAINAFDTNEYLVHANDSVVFTYLSTTPVVASANGPSLKYDYNFDNYSRKRFSSAKYSPLVKYFNVIPFYDEIIKSKIKPTPAQKLEKTSKLTYEQRMKIMLGRVDKFRAALYTESMTLLRSQNNLLDSLKEQKLISEAPYHFYKTRAQNLGYVLDIEVGRLSSDQISAILAAYTPNPYGYPELYYHQLLEAVADKYIMGETPFLDLKDGVNRDYRQVYIRLRNSLIFPERDKNYLLTRELNRIAQTFSRADFRAFFRKYEQDVKDTALVTAVRSDYALEFDESRAATKSVVLVDAKGNKLTLDALLKRHKGKVIYVDFWASWCGPCREALPQSTKLRSELKDSQVVFVYLSIDKILKPWLAASGQEKLATHPENYLVVNYQTADFMKQQKLTSIPRYMVFDKTGKLAYTNAPSAENKNLPALLVSLSK